MTKIGVFARTGCEKSFICYEEKTNSPGKGHWTFFPHQVAFRVFSVPAYTTVS